MSKVTVTANGNAIDMEAIRLKNEKTVAVGNMRVNARGDELSPTTGQVTRSRNDRMTDYYKLQGTVPTKRARNTAEPEPVGAAAPTPATATPVAVKPSARAAKTVVAEAPTEE